MALWTWKDNSECGIREDVQSRAYLEARGVFLDGAKKFVIREYYSDSRKEGYQKPDTEYSEDMQDFIKDVEPIIILIDPSAASFMTQLRKDGFKGIKEADNNVPQAFQM